MSLKSAAQSGDERPKQVDSPYLTSREALAYLRLKSLSALYSHIRDNKLPVCRCGGDLRFDMRELDAWLRGFGSAVEMHRVHNRDLRAVSHPRQFGEQANK